VRQIIDEVLLTVVAEDDQHPNEIMVKVTYP